MNVGDLVRYNHPKWHHWYGLVLKEIPGTDETKVVMWNKENNVVTSNPKRHLEVISERR